MGEAGHLAVPARPPARHPPTTDASDDVAAAVEMQAGLTNLAPRSANVDEARQPYGDRQGPELAALRQK